MTEIQRDRWDRPLIIPLGEDGKPDLEAKLVPYQRISTVAGSLDDKSNLMKWKQRVTALGLARRPDQLLLVQGILALYDDPLNDPKAKVELNRIIDVTDEAGGGNSAAAAGTGYHGLTEAADLGRGLPEGISGDVRQRIEEYIEAVREYQMLDIETFVVNDVTLTAGTFDRLMLCPDGAVRVGDLKTGKDDPEYPLKLVTQLAPYAYGKRYNPKTGERTPLHPNLDPTVGILIHMPQRGEGTRVYPNLNLVKGWEAALVAKEVSMIRKWKTSELIGAALSS